MRGRHALRIQSAHLRYDLEFSRNVTVIQGDSATGKTTLVDMVQEYLLNGSDTGISLVCDCPCRVVAGSTWREQLATIEGSIVFIDEGNRFVSSVDFAQAVRGSGNYFVIVTREALDNLPYSVTEIYGIKSSGKYGSLEPVYHEMYRIYGELKQADETLDVLLTEDSNSGYDFFSSVAPAGGAECLSAGGAAKVFGALQEFGFDQRVVVIADGAAFGSQMGRVYQLAERRGNICLYLPESFEWIILSSGILNDGEVRRILDNPSEYIDSADYFSWERFFTDELVRRTRGTWLQYTKSRLNPVYVQGGCRGRILAVLPADVQRLMRAGTSRGGQ